MLTTITVMKECRINVSSFLSLFMPHTCQDFARNEIARLKDMRLQGESGIDQTNQSSANCYAARLLRFYLTHRKDLGPVNCAIITGSTHFTIVATGCAITWTISSFRQARNFTRVKSIISPRRPSLLA